MTAPGRLSANPEFVALQNQVRQIQQKLSATSRVANTAAPTQAAKRFRIACKTLGITLAGAAVSFDVVWSAPMPTDVYNVDVACSALLGMPVVTVSALTKTGCTVAFVTPLLATNAVVIVLGVSAA